MRPPTTQLTGSVHSFDLSTGVDGPGSRFVAFLAGCPLRCLYCHSPDTWYQRSGRTMSVDELMLEVERYRRFIHVGGGGVTISGGEPLQQCEFTRSVLQRCQDLRLHTALDTSGFVGERADDALLDVTDLVLLDIKSWDPSTYRQVTGTGANLAGLAEFVAGLATVERVEVLPYHTLGVRKYTQLGLPDPLPGTRIPTTDEVAHARAVFEAHGLTTY